MQGHPFMESIRENKPLMISLVGTYSFIVFLALGWSSELCEQFGIIQFPEEVITFSQNSAFLGATLDQFYSIQVLYE